MNEAIIGAISISVLFGMIMVIINVRKALKNPEQYQKMTDDVYKQLGQAKDNMKKSISWEDAKKQAQAEIAYKDELKRKKKEEKKQKK